MNDLPEARTDRPALRLPRQSGAAGRVLLIFIIAGCGYGDVDLPHISELIELIADFGPHLHAPAIEDADVIDGGGACLAPGLVDMRVQLGEPLLGVAALDESLGELHGSLDRIDDRDRDAMLDALRQARERCAREDDDVRLRLHDEPDIDSRWPPHPCRKGKCVRLEYGDTWSVTREFGASKPSRKEDNGLAVDKNVP